MLRYYDEVELFQPAGIDKWTRHCNYFIEQIPILNRIIYLRDSGFNASEIVKTLDKKANSLIEFILKHFTNPPCPASHTTVNCRLGEKASMKLPNGICFNIIPVKIPIDAHTRQDRKSVV